MPLALIPLIAILLKLLIVRIILATGMTFVTYAGYLIALNKFKGYVANAVNSMPQPPSGGCVLKHFLIGWLVG